ncbi:MAG: CapA family protein [Puniceicoccales bacterium]|jgi:poly-gamma-glutamate synthesis protein (capsule biosynthesis protein)|nr:CapA family protein [Puniceicoccales bacterium]
MACDLLFTGDIMASITLNEVCKTENGYDYNRVFSELRPILKNADLVVGNLETPLAGEAARYSFAQYSFNTPDEFARQLKEDGFGLLSLANNHCMDRGIDGLRRTIDALDTVGIAHTGAYRSKEERGNICILKRGDINFAFLSYTYGTNAFFHHNFLPEDAQYAVNRIQPEETLPGAIDLLERDAVAARVHELYEVDNPLYQSAIQPYWQQIKEDIDLARKQGGEVIVMLLHVGGQRDAIPDAYTKYVVNRLAKMGVDAIICNHQHVLHNVSMIGHVPVVWCLGNLVYTVDAGKAYEPREMESSLLKMRWEKINGIPRLSGMTGIPTQSVLDKNGGTAVYPLKILIDNNQGREKDRLLAVRQRNVNLLRNLPEMTPVGDCLEYSIMMMP